MKHTGNFFNVNCFPDTALSSSKQQATEKNQTREERIKTGKNQTRDQFVHNHACSCSFAIASQKVLRSVAILEPKK